MKKPILILLIHFFAVNLFAQKIINYPESQLSTLPGAITKIELLEGTTILHFKIKGTTGQSIYIPKKSYIQDLSGADKLFVTKVSGAKMGKNVYPDSGVLQYQLHFPKLKPNVESIDFGEANDNGSWFVYGMVIKEMANNSFPKEIKGNWLIADGSNEFKYGFYTKTAILDNQVWNYKSVEKKGKKYTITLERGGKVVTVFAKLSKDGIVEFGRAIKDLKPHSLKPLFNKEFKIKDNGVYNESMFKIDSTTYSGIIKGYSDRVGQSTGTIYVNNAFLGDQETFLIKIAKDGSFSVKFPINHPQMVMVRLPYMSTDVLVEPGKETFQIIDGKSSFFTGDCAKVNSDLKIMERIPRFNYSVIRNKIGVTSPEDYKKFCFDYKDDVLKQLRALEKEHNFSNKAIQIKEIHKELETLQRILGYAMNRRSLKYYNEKAKSEKDKKPYKEFKIEPSYYQFVTQKVLENKMGVLSNQYYFFVNRLMYLDIFRSNQRSSYTLVELANLLKEANKALTVDELNMVEMSKEIQTPEIMAKEAAFRSKYGENEQSFYRKYSKHFGEFSKYAKEQKLEEKYAHFIPNVANYLIKTKGLEFTEAEKELVEAIKSLKTDEEQFAEKNFNKTFSEVRSNFYKKYREDITELYRNKSSLDSDKKIKDYFGVNNSFVFDVIASQRASAKLKDYEVYSEAKLKGIQQKIETPIISEYLALANQRTKAEIELNKTKGGYNVNTVNKTEGDELFDAMLKKFKGKVVYVDFWATWCGPCKSGIKRIMPLKEEMKNEDVVFLYITNQTSPEGTWKNSIANIKGEHYRVSADEWNYLKDKFKITGIPHYTLVNRKGEIVKPKLGHMGNDALKKVLMAEVKK